MPTKAVNAPRKIPQETSSIRARLFWPLVICVLIFPALTWHFGAKAQKNSAISSAKHSRPGPWGDLEYTPIAIEIPDDFVHVEQTDPTDWFFKGATREQAENFLKTCDLGTSELDYLLREAVWNCDGDGCHLIPNDEFIWNLKSDSREKIYDALAVFPENINQFYAFTYRPEKLNERLEASGLSDETIAMFKKLLYRSGGLLRFADVDIVLRKLTDKEQKVRLVKTVSRRSSLLIKLNITPQTDVDSLVNYWSNGRRSKDLRPLLESLKRVSEGCKIDIAHLLTPFARQRLYTYPRPELDVAQDCHWTSLNFFNDQPNPTFNSPEEVVKQVETEFVEIGEGLQNARFGDVIFLKNSEDITVHSAVYIADDIVFTKNGGGANQPWICMKMEDMLPYYLMPNDTLKVVTFRRKM